MRIGSGGVGGGSGGTGGAGAAVTLRSGCAGPLQAAVHDQEQLVLVLMMMPRKNSGQLYQLNFLAI